MINFIRMKKAEWRIKEMFYGAITTILDNQKEILDFIQAMYIALKDLPAEELQKEFISKLAEIVHEENKDKNN